MTKNANSNYARPPAPPAPAEAPAKAPVKVAAKKTKKAKGTVAKSKQGRTPAAAGKRLGKSLKRLVKNSRRTLSGSLALKGKSKPAKKK